jgi:hypothetical protein
MADIDVMGSLFDNVVKTKGRRLILLPFPETVGEQSNIQHPNRFKEQPEHDPVKSWSNAASIFADSTEVAKRLAFGNITNSNDTLYIMGQCAAGSNKLYSLDQTSSIGAAAIVKMITPYLDSEFPGKVKVYACHSATGGGNGIDSFAKRLADEMRMQGYCECTYIGYNAQVSGFATKDFKGSANVNDPSGQHKWVLDGPNTGKRARAAVVEIPLF